MNDLSSKFKALSEPVRLRALALVMAHRELCVCEVEEFLEISQSAASRHLRTLASAGWLEPRREEQWVYYRIPVPRDTEQKVLLDAIRTVLARVDVPDIERDLEELRRARCGGPEERT